MSDTVVEVIIETGLRGGTGATGSRGPSGADGGPIGDYAPDWVVAAEGNQSNLLLDRGPHRLHAATQDTVCKVTDPNSKFFTGSALRGRYKLTAQTSVWFTNNFRFTVQMGLLPVRVIGTTSPLADLIFVPYGMSDTNFQISLQLGDNGAVSVRIGHDITGGGDNWTSDPITGWDWRDGIPVGNLVITGVGMSTTEHQYVGTWNGDEIFDETLVAQDPYEAPDDGTDLYIGGQQPAPVIIKSASLFKTLPSAVMLYSFNVLDLAGWTADGAIVLAEPSYAALPITSGGYGVDDALFDIASDGSFSVVWHGTFDDNMIAIARNLSSIAGSLEGWGVGSNYLYGVVPQAWVCDGTDTARTLDLGTYDSRVTIGFTLDRSTDTLTVFRNGVVEGDDDATDIGAIAPDTPMGVNSGLGYMKMAAFFKRALNNDEHLGIHEILSVDE